MLLSDFFFFLKKAYLMFIPSISRDQGRSVLRTKCVFAENHHDRFRGRARPLPSRRLPVIASRSTLAQFLHCCDCDIGLPWECAREEIMTTVAIGAVSIAAGAGCTKNGDDRMIHACSRQRNRLLYFQWFRVETTR